MLRFDAVIVKFRKKFSGPKMSQNSPPTFSAFLRSPWTMATLISPLRQALMPMSPALYRERTSLSIRGL
jgi:hypothetical protein